jgi:hypothetical protein
MVSDHKDDLGFTGAFEPVAPHARPDAVPEGRRPGVFVIKPWLIVGAVLVLGAALFGFMKLLSGTGKELVANNSRVIGQVDHTKDSTAQVAAQNALTAARTLILQSGSYTGVSPASLAKTEPVYRYSNGPSTNENVVSVATSATQVGLAVSAGKTCWYLAYSETGGATFGSGTGPCTGAVALETAKAPAW